MNYLFVYGSLIAKNSPFKFSPLESIFIEGYKLYIEKKQNSENNYHFIKLQKTEDTNDIVSGYLVEVSDDILQKLDTYEGSSYKRVEIEAMKRTLEKVKVFVYV